MRDRGGSMTWGEGGLPNLLQNHNRREGSTETPNLDYVINGLPLISVMTEIVIGRG